MLLFLPNTNPIRKNIYQLILYFNSCVCRHRPRGTWTVWVNIDSKCTCGCQVNMRWCSKHPLTSETDIAMKSKMSDTFEDSCATLSLSLTQSCFSRPWLW